MFRPGRLVLQLAASLAVPAACATWMATHLFPEESGFEAAWALVVPAALGAVIAAALVFRLLIAPVARALSSSAPSARERQLAVDAALRVPSRMAVAVVLLAAAAIGAVLAVQLGRGRPPDVAAAEATGAVAFGIMAAMLAHSVSSSGLASAVAALGPVEAPTRSSIRTRVLLLSSGLLAFGLLLLGPLAYARYRLDGDREATGRAARGLERAALHLGPGDPAPAIAAAAIAVDGPVALVSGAGEVTSRAGDGAAPSAPARGPPLERVPGGWRVRRALGDGRALIAFVSEEPLQQRRRAFFGENGILGLAILAASSLLVWLVVRSLTLPLRALGRAADRVAAGDLTAAPPSVTRDEIGALAAGFRRMTSGLAGLVQDVQEASRFVLDGTHEMEAIGARVRAGAAEERAQVGGVEDAVAAMQESVALAGRGVEGLSGYVASTTSALAEMSASLEDVRRQAVELERLAGAVGRDVERIAESGRHAQTQLAGLDDLAGNAGGSIAAVQDSLSGLENSAVASQLAAAQAAELAETAGVVVREAADGIEGVRAAVGDAKRRVTALGRRSDDVDRILDFIGEVAGRTNLLSLNASIIATQAGEHGKAFAVVAEQIRELAAQISSSTKSIVEIIRAVREDVEGTARLIDRGDEQAAGGVALARKSLGALEELRMATARGHETAAAIQGALQAHLESSREVSQLVESVAANSKALGEAVGLVGKSVQGVGQVTRGVNGLADRVARALEETSGLGKRQLEALGRIDAMISGIARAMERHGQATRRVQDSLRWLARTARQHEAAVSALGGVSGRLGAHSRALAERVGRFKVDGAG